MENLMHKSELNSYCQRIGIPLPVYKTTFQGDCHASLSFACTVSVGGNSFTSSSSSTFTNRKSAEHDAAKLALQYLLNQDEAGTENLRKLVCQDKARCKMILKEFIDKIKIQGCVYETVKVEKTHVFVSSLTLNGTCYKGECGKSKKEAERLAALSAILSLLDDPAYATSVSEVIKSKFSGCAVYNELKEFPKTCDCSFTSNEFKATPCNSDAVAFTQKDLLIGKSSFEVLVDEKKMALVDLHANSIEEEQGGSGILVSEDKQVLVNSQIEKKVNKASLIQTEKQGVLDDPQCVSGHLPGAVTISRCSYVPLPRTSPLVSAAAHYPCNDLIPSKKRRKKNRNKANKRLRAEKN